MAKNIYDNSKVQNWDEIPNEWKNVEAVREVVFDYNPKDSRLYSFLAYFVGHDDIRPVMSGVNFDDIGVTATHAHKMFHKRINHGYKDGIYDASGKKIDGKYPNYPNILRYNSPHSYKIDVLKLKTYCQVIERGKYANQTTFQIRFKYKKDGSAIGFNSKFLIPTLNAVLALGYREAWFHFDETPNRAMVISPEKEYSKKDKIIDWIMLLMPVMLNNEMGGAIGYAGGGSVQDDKFKALYRVAKNRDSSDKFVGEIQYQILENKNSELKDLLIQWSNLPENKDKFKSVGWFGIASAFFDEVHPKKSEPIPTEELYYGAEDLDWDVVCRAYFDFTDNEIKNADGSVVFFDENQTDYHNPIFSKGDLSLIKKITSKDSSLPVINYMAVDKGEARITDLEFSALWGGIQIPDGLYSPINGSFRLVYDSQMYHKRDGEPKPLSTDEFPIPYSDDIEFRSKFIVSSSVLIDKFSILEKFIGNDDFRPVMSGIHLREDNGELIGEATDAHVACMTRISAELRNNEDFNAIVARPDLILGGLKGLQEQPITVEYGYSKGEQKDARLTKFVHDTGYLLIRNIDGKFPNVQQVYANEATKEFVFSYSELKNIANDVKKIKVNSSSHNKYKRVFFKMDDGKYQADLAYNYRDKDEKDIKPIGKGSVQVKKSAIQIPDKYNTFLIMAVFSPNDGYELGIDNKLLELALNILSGSEQVRIFEYKHQLLFANETGGAFNEGLSTKPVQKIIRKMEKPKPIQPKLTSERQVEASKQLVEKARAKARARIRILKLKKNS